jgi:hypothetical protein
MARTTNIITEFLRNIGALEPVRLGPSKKVVAISAEEKRLLVDRLTRAATIANSLVIVITALHITLFGVAIWLVYFYRNVPTLVSIMLGGSLLSLLSIARGLKEVWREKWSSDMLVALLPNLTADEAIKVMKIVMYSSKVVPGTAGHVTRRHEAKE